MSNENKNNRIELIPRLLAVLTAFMLINMLRWFITPIGYYHDYHQHYIDNANTPAFDWFAIMMGGVSVNDTALLLIVTTLVIYMFASREKDELGHTSIKGKHIACGLTATAIMMRVLFDVMFLVNYYSCDDYKDYTTTIKNKLGISRVEIVVDSILLTYDIEDDHHAMANNGDTITLKVGKGCFGYYALGKEYKIKYTGEKPAAMDGTSKEETAKDSRRQGEMPRRYTPEERKMNDERVIREARKYSKKTESKAEYREKLNNRINDFNFKAKIYDSMQLVTCQHKDMKGDLAISFRVEGRADKTITDIIIINNTNKKIDKTIHDFIEQSELIKKLDNGIYIFKMEVKRGFLEEEFIKKVKKKKEDFEELLFMHMYKAMPAVKGLRGSAFIDITIQPDNTISKAVVAQGLNPKVDKVALECAKRIPWTANMDGEEAGEKHFRLTVMYAKDKLWKVKIWSMDY